MIGYGDAFWLGAVVGFVVGFGLCALLYYATRPKS